VSLALPAETSRTTSLCVTRELEADFTADLAHCVEFSATEYEGRRRTARFVDSTTAREEGESDNEPEQDQEDGARVAVLAEHVLEHSSTDARPARNTAFVCDRVQTGA
jgi:hypothetical protein